MNTAPPAVTYPDAGVMATSPATAPAAAPTTLTLRLCAYDASTHVIVAAAAATLVTRSALAATPFAARADPALNPNQPNHSSPAPSTVIGTSCGSRLLLSPNDQRRPISTAATSAETPDDMWTTVPPA